MRLEFTPQAWEDFEYWMQNDPAMARKMLELLQSIRQTPFAGIGKPEPLRYQLQGCWSRRLSAEHRLVYLLSGAKGPDQKCIVLQCRFHYDR
ncbi:MAG: Txe/YoeB family addiction module toxin [Sphingobacteriaceae bacterium]|nr:Txe/YoeB family addiction module toxin [Sphingobacteriaceae bacterium]